MQRDNPCEKVRIPSMKNCNFAKKHFKKSEEKNAKNALTSHYANGHGDPCDKWVKNQLAVSTAHQVHFGTGLAIFQSPQHVWGLWKIARKPSCFVKFGCGNG